MESSPVKIYGNNIRTISSPHADVNAQTLSSGFLCCGVFRGERTWSVSQIYHIPGLYPDPFNEVSNVSVHVSISSGMSDKCVLWRYLQIKPPGCLSEPDKRQTAGKGRIQALKEGGECKTNHLQRRNT